MRVVPQTRLPARRIRRRAARELHSRRRTSCLLDSWLPRCVADYGAFSWELRPSFSTSRTRPRCRNRAEPKPAFAAIIGPLYSSLREFGQSPWLVHGLAGSTWVLRSKGAACGEIMNLIISRAASGSFDTVSNATLDGHGLLRDPGNGPTYCVPGTPTMMLVC